MKKTISTLAMILIMAAAHAQNGGVMISGTPAKQPEYTYNIISAPGKTYGYDILVDKKLSIHQTTPPGITGNKGFKTKDGAIKVAELVISKMKNGQMPPTVTVDEMKKLGAL